LQNIRSGRALIQLQVDEEVLLLGPALRRHHRPIVTKQRQRLTGLLPDEVHRPQQRHFVIQRFAVIADKRRRNAQRLAKRPIHQKRRADRIPGRVASRLERGPQTAGR
jgi:hypothetical protein